MPTWGEILKEIQDSGRQRAARGQGGPDFDGIRLKYIRNLHNLSRRAVISYASGWMNGQAGGAVHSVEASDVHGMMEVCHGVQERELDLILHSPGGSAQTAEQIVEYLRTRFDYIRAIVPLQAKSAATMIALGCDEVVIGDHSELGPIDPQILIPVPEGMRYAPAHAILRDFQRAKEECVANVANIAAWTPILRSYSGGLIEFCHQQIKLSIELVQKWVSRYMLSHADMAVPEDQRQTRGQEIAEWFGSEESYDRFRTHGRPIRYPELSSVGVRVRRLEDDPQLQDSALSIFHASEITFGGPAAKIIENHLGRRYVRRQAIQVPVSSARPNGPEKTSPNPNLTRQQRRALERKGR